MKKWRCPHCGRECIGFADRWSAAMDTYRWNSMHRETGEKCKECGKTFDYYTSRTRSSVALLILITSISLILCLAYFVHVVFLLLLLFLGIINPIININQPIIPNSSNIIPDANATVIVADSDKLKNLMVYGIQTKNAGNDSQLTKCFDKGVFAR